MGIRRAYMSGGRDENAYGSSEGCQSHKIRGKRVYLDMSEDVILVFMTALILID